METALVFKLGILSTLSFLIAMWFTPVLIHFLYKYKLGKQIRSSKSAPIFAKFHLAKEGTPTMGGILIWATVAFVTLLTFVLSQAFPTEFFARFDFLSREQTILPLGVLIIAALIGLLDDWLGIKKIGPKGGGMSILFRLGLYTLVATLGALWFYFKLDWDVFHVPFIGNFIMGWWYIPLFIFIVVGTAFSVNETDGLDGLAGGILGIAFAAMGAIAITQSRFDLATFCAVIIGALLAFLWFNINPAKFFMGDTGAMSLGITLGVIAMYTNTAILLVLILFIPVLETFSVILQTLSKKIRHKKIFHSAPFHHHLQALGWPETQIVMRLWLINIVAAVVGVAIFLLDKGWY
ncbi:TPA: phospho-N-acetylmuramoyl-pentapeptide-transferase [Candidatus Falkowbacteria bacterium]|nr:phospho-N-acetylmuramoyl-pentapeptide-transferase [Candidatus Falkowbacteria bacterium]